MAETYLALTSLFDLCFEQVHLIKEKLGTPFELNKIWYLYRVLINQQLQIFVL